MAHPAVRTLTATGRPKHPESLFVAVKRQHLKLFPPQVGEEISMPVRFVGKYETLRGKILQVNSFADGALIICQPLQDSLLEKWDQFAFWHSLDPTKASGVLSCSFNAS